MHLSIAPADLVVIIVYLIGIVGIGCWAGMRRRRGAAGEGYFLAGKSLTWPIIGLALFSTNISTIHLVSLAQEGYDNGLAYGNFEWMAAFTLIALSLFFAPFYIRSNVATLPDFLEKRYNRWCRDWLAIVSIVSAIFIHIGFSLYTGATVLRGLFGVDENISIIVVALLTGLYTIIGGLLAVVLTESIQAVILLIGAICITAMAYAQIGGWSGLAQSVDPVMLTILRSAEDPSHLPWYSVFLGYPVIGLWYWCADQTIVQRVLGAKDENHARVGPLFAGFIKILPVFIFVLPGLLCLGLVNQGHFDSSPATSADTYAFLISHVLPVGLRGLVVAALLAALMSTVSGALNSTATLFSYDIYKRWNPGISDRSLVVMGRWVTFFAMIAAIIWSRYIGRFESIFQGISAIICYIAPPITAVFVWGIFWKRASSVAALITLWIGAALGFTVFLLDWFKESTGWNIPFLMTTFYLFLICSAILFAVSLIAPHRHTAESRALVWNNPMDALRGPAWRGIGNYKFLSCALLITVIFLYIKFA
ncbi:MAG: sodium:solute symporter [Candidatus Omnitrophota bacterium]|jgi:SSS family solute:Na+ symporter|nr:MAG: sodium:solute symporter [Candidatus Omnitrophota bacterium]